MNDLKKRFIEKHEKFPQLGDVIIMSMAVDKMKYPKEVIRNAFNKLVSKEEYELDEKSEIINYLNKYSNNE